MKTLDQVIKEYKSDTIDGWGPDLSRLCAFVPEDKLKYIGIELKDEYKGKHMTIPFTRENVLKQLERDVDFGFKKALGQRGISASLMFEVVRMWNWILEDGLEDWSEYSYAMYGLPLLKATAEKYGFDNPIGEDSGTEQKYNE